VQDYLIQVAYTPEAMAALVANPQDRSEVVRPVVEKLGGTLKSAYFAFGEYDVIVLVSMPSNVDAGALAMAFAGGGALKSVKTTPLLSIAEGVEALRKAGTAGYQPPQKVAKAGS
jgi:uncharacterized protein with GYD domain